MSETIQEKNARKTAELTKLANRRHQITAVSWIYEDNFSVPDVRRAIENAERFCQLDQLKRNHYLRKFRFFKHIQPPAQSARDTCARWASYYRLKILIQEVQHDIDLEIYKINFLKHLQPQVVNNQGLWHPVADHQLGEDLVAYDVSELNSEQSDVDARSVCEFASTPSPSHRD